VNAIDLLERQHREVEGLFEELDEAGEDATKTRERLCREISDQLAVHAEIEERLFYPESKEAGSEERLRQSVEQHLSVKRLLAENMEVGVADPRFGARMKVVEAQLRHHVEEEEKELFPRVRRSSSKDALEDLGNRMEELAKKLMGEEEPSSKVAGRTDQPSPV
jgi:hemerythrin superfamily protein